MDNAQLFSRRTAATVDFRPDSDPNSPFAQLRRLTAHLQAQIPPADDITDCSDALNYLREYTYRKIFTGTSHQEYVQLDSECPEAIDWLIAVHQVESQAFRNTQLRTKENKR
jgi:hypothetical protein